MQLVVTQSDLEQIEAVIEDFLNGFHPDLNVSRGTPLNDILVQAHKVPIALVSSIATSYRETRSIAGLRRLLDATSAGDPTDPDIIAAKADISAATTELLSNWYFKQLDGRKARGLITIHTSSNVGFTIPTSWRAYRTNALPFGPISDTTIVVNSSDMTPVVDSDGVVTEYLYRLMVESEHTGDIGDVSPGEWESFDRINVFMTKVTSDFTFTRGADDESVLEQLDRAETYGVSERTLDNQRALSAFFADNFPEYLPVTSIRAGYPEMQRDLIDLGGTFRMHQLGHWNIYLGGTILESQSVKLNLGSQFVHPLNNTAELGIPHRALLPTHPMLFIREIRWVDDLSDPILSTYADADGYVRFNLINRYYNTAEGLRANTPYTDYNQAKLIPIDDKSMLHWNSAKQGMFLELNPNTFKSTNPEIEVIYDAISGFESIDSYIDSADNRPGAGNPLAYSYYPAVLSFDLDYVRRSDILESVSVDVDSAKRELTSFIRNQTRGTPLFASEIMREFMSLYGDIAAGVKPLTLKYYAILPDGSRVDFETTDRVAFDYAFLSDTSYVPKDEYGSSIPLTHFQYSDRTMVVYTDEVNIRIQQST